MDEKQKKNLMSNRNIEDMDHGIKLLVASIIEQAVEDYKRLCDAGYVSGLKQVQEKEGELRFRGHFKHNQDISHLLDFFVKGFHKDLIDMAQLDVGADTIFEFLRMYPEKMVRCK